MATRAKRLSWKETAEAFQTTWDKVLSAVSMAVAWGLAHRDLDRKRNLETFRAYLLEESFQGWWHYVSPTWAGKFLDRWCTRTMRARIEPMKKIARQLRSHRELLLNWFKASSAISLGAVEGLNNRLKLTFRKSYGFRTLQCTEIAIYHAMGDLPEPSTTHRSC